MLLKEKIFMDHVQLAQEGPINIVVFGDSVTHGIVEIDVFDYETVYWNRLRKKILEIRDYVPVNVINAGIGGITAKDSLSRLDNQVLSHRPDLVIVCFGLNDVNGTLEDYLDSLKVIFKKCQKSGAEVVFMTPNMLNTYVAEDTLEHYKDYAAVTANYQNSGKMDLFMNSATDLAKEMQITVCDCYSQWKLLGKTSDITLLLANRINHPTREMHELFAQSLFETLFQDLEVPDTPKEDAMYLNKQ